MRDARASWAKLLAVVVMVLAVWGTLAVPRFWWLVLGMLVVVVPLLRRAN
jgi:hypothetical protein